MLQKFPLFYHDIILHPPFNYSRWKNIPEPSSLPDFFAVDVILLAVDVILRPLQPQYNYQPKIFIYTKYHDIISCPFS
jgi:hypothetical protein